MMAVRVSAGALLLVLLAGQSSSYPAKKGKGYDSMAPSGGFVPVGSGVGGGPVTTYSSGSGAGYGSGVGGGPVTTYGSGYGSGSGAGYGSGYGSGVGGGPVTTYSSGSAFGPAASGHTGSSFAGPAASVYFSPAARQGVAWSVEPPSFMSSEVTSASLGSSSNVGPAGFRPQYQGGELSQAQNIYEFGNSESETEDQGAHSSSDARFGGPGFASQSSAYGSGQAIYPYPYPYPYDYMFLTGQYAPGTVTHASSSFEQGRDNWEDIHYVWEYRPIAQEVQTFDAVKQSSQPVKQESPSQSGWTTYPRAQIPPLPRLG